MLMLFFVLFSWNLVQADVLLYTKKVHKTQNFVLTTPGNKSRKDLFFEVPAPNIDLNITSYDWSVSTEQLLENQLYNYKDDWWVTIRDNKLDNTTPIAQDTVTQKTLEQTTANATEAFTETNSTVTNNNAEIVASKETNATVTNNNETSTTITNNENINSEVRTSKIYTAPKNAVRDKNVNSKIGKEIIKNLNIDSDSGTNVRANAAKRNKQIQRMLVEIAPQVNKTNATAITSVKNLNKLGVDVKKLGQNHSMNLLYNKVVESLQLNVDANKIDELGSLKIEDIKKYYGLDGTQPTVKTVIASTVEVLNPINRQGASNETINPHTPPYSSLEDPEPGAGPPGTLNKTSLSFTSLERIPELWGGKSSSNESTYPHTPPHSSPERHPDPDDNPPWLQDHNWWMTTTERPVDLVADLKKQMGMFRTGYFTIFASHAAYSISEMDEKYVRLIGLSVERECFNLIHVDKHILSFGQPFLSAFERFATNFVSFPPDYVQDRAMVLRHQIWHRKVYMPEDLNSIFDYIDNLYEEDEGLALFKAAELLDKYPNTTKNSFEIVHEVFKAIFAPYNRIAGSIKRQILVDSINDFLLKLNMTFVIPDGPEMEKVNSTKNIQRRHRYSNRTRFEVVSRDIKNNWINKKKQDCFGKYCFDEENTKYNDVKKLISKIKGASFNKRHKTSKGVKKQAGTRCHSTLKHLKNPQKQHKKVDFKQKHPNIYYKYIQLKRKVHKKHNKREKLREFESRYYGTQKLFDKLNGYEKFSRLKAEKLKHKKIHNLSETDFDEVYSSYDTESLNSDESYYTYDTDENELKHDSRFIPGSIKDKKSTLNTRNVGKSLSNLNKASKKTTRTLQTNVAKKATESNHVKIKYFYGITDQAAKLKLRNAKNSKTVKADSSIKTKKTVSKLNKFKDGISIHKKDISKHNVHRSTTVKFVITPIDTAKNKLTVLSSYSDEEDILKFQIIDAMRHGKNFLKPIRRSNLKKRLKNGINEFSSYSSEEVVLKSNIYKALGFENFTTPNGVFKRANDNGDGIFKKIRFEKIKPINELSSYSDEEDILREKIKLQN